MKSLFDLFLRVAMFFLLLGIIGAIPKMLGAPMAVVSVIAVIGAVLVVSFLASGENW